MACGKQFEVILSGAGWNVASWKGLVRRNDESENVHVLEIRTASVREEKIADTDTEYVEMVLSGRGCTIFHLKM